jgi:DNA alkylation repair enzyme
MSEASTKAGAFVAAHLEAARATGEALARLIDEPDAYLERLSAGLVRLADPDYLAMVTRACPETPARYVIRGPLSTALMKPVRQALRDGSSVFALRLAHRLVEADHRDLRLYSHEPLRRALPEDPEMSWQLMRRLGRLAGDWIATDSLADLWARGVLAEDFRWAELEQLLYSQHVYERRLVPATLATIPHRVPAARRDELRPQALGRALELIRQLMGDAAVMVQKALSWALREWTPVDQGALADVLVAETDIAVDTQDGARAWVIRDALSKQSPTLANELADRLAGLRRDRSAPSTSIASTQAAAFAAALASSNDAVAVQGDRYTRSRT